MGNESGEPIAEKQFQNADGRWVAIQQPRKEQPPFDEQVKLVAPPIEGVPYHIETMDGRTFSGRAGAEGLLPRTATYGEDEYTV